jgi:hypothetical protein
MATKPVNVEDYLSPAQGRLLPKIISDQSQRRNRHEAQSGGLRTLSVDAAPTFIPIWRESKPARHCLNQTSGAI